MKKLTAKEICETAKAKWELGIRYGVICIKNDGCYKEIPERDLPIILRGLYLKIDTDISSGLIQEAIQRLREDPELQLEFTEEKTEIYVNIKNGVFNTETGEMKNLSDKQKFGYCLNFAYIRKEKRKISEFDRFVSSVFPDEKEDKKKLLLRIMGYCISDYTKAKAGFFLIGESNSGKSTILALMESILPERSVTAIPLYRLENRFNLARLAGARVNISTELSEKSFRALDIYKMMTSCEVVTAEHKGQKPFEFRIRCKSINAGNLLPDLDQAEGMEAVLNRMVILLFPVSIPKEKQDMKLLDKLIAEKDSIFSAALDELHNLCEENFVFTEPKDTKKLKAQMRAKSGCFQDFVRECCICEKNAEEHFVTLYEAFEEYSEENLIDVKLTKSQFSQKIVQMPGIERGKFRINGSRPLYGARGIRLKKAEEYTLQDSERYSKNISESGETRNNGTTELEVQS